MTVSDKLDRVFLRLCGPSRAGASPSPPPHASSGPAPDKQDVDPERSSSDDNQSPHKICGACQNIDFDGLLDEERAENELGPLTNHLDEECSFCNLLFLGVQHHWGEEWTPERLCGESEEIPTVFVQSRSPLSVKQRGHIEYPHPRILVALDVEAPGFSENRRVIREIDRVKNRHIIAEIESVHHEGFVSNLIRPPLVPRREVGADVDIELIKSWLHDCKSHEHTFKAQEQMEQGKVDLDFFSSRCGFRLLDVEEECLVLKTEPCAFAALSYVWGRLPTVLQPAKDAKEPPILLCTKDNLDRLSAAGGLSSEAIEHVEHARLPQTITDAIEFSRRIGMRYLWVDTLCIVQDDPSDKCYLIQAMDNIYDIATVTYIAISGKNADAGLGGISPRKGRPVDHIVVAGREAEHKLSLSPPSLNEEVRRSTWDTRGWTFQEQALSQRCLYFTPDEIFFNCIESIRREAYNIESTTSKSDVKLRTGPPWWNRKLRKDPDPTPYRYLGDLTGTLTVTDYQLAVQAYSRRTLSFPEDVLTAFEGVFNRFSRRATCDDLVLQQTQGIPVEHMHQALLWFPSDETVKRLDVSDASGERFSSWSWASWSGPIEFIFTDSMWISRNISMAPAKKLPLHILIPIWHYGGTDKRFYSHGIWKAAYETPQEADEAVAKECNASKCYSRKKIGLEMDRLLDLSKDEEEEAKPKTLKEGQLGFWGASVTGRQGTLQFKSGRIWELRIGFHVGEFRFDNGQHSDIDEFVAVITADTITKPPDTQCTLLGLCTRNGISTRAGVGWVYFSKEEDVELPPWSYKFFKVA